MKQVKKRTKKAAQKQNYVTPNSQQYPASVAPDKNQTAIMTRNQLKTLGKRGRGRGRRR
ncbi:hypothetical protein OXYTRIMIC_113 [Oxytricha trifallax]|uniref:Uncharacterized protein n=1 Tax=Oxytricha trifallax TaxID=1172189 RepID=A0A073HYU1_9SPIT|nr:hypothetical protein OXYTRIMIC_113 [Oxytricha trifallax]